MAQKKPTPKQAQPSTKTIIIVISIFALLAVVTIAGVLATSLVNKPTSAEPTSLTSEDTPISEEPTEETPTEEAPTTSGTYFADITVKDYGTITVQLDGDTAPITVENFVSLAKSGFYDGLTFHRIMDGFMMQGGDPTGTGSGDSGTDIIGEFSANGVENNISHTRGTISMARATDYNSASCQFFIVQSDSTFLDGQYAGFGHVTEGMEYVDAICADAEPTDDNGTIAPEAQPIIESIVIREP